ncbi:PKD domain-containing protein [Methanosarcina sp. MSH10X1]|uniref:PKD domain-containing protein n=1 Tax=Methanosarcina sp. MSH10X1 TaxID=2507075 RepID=UPI000FFC120C|nr:PKD domain-containing protein [Methanosarcina sp. MSH10X1]RXA21360.1 PKD domain-containing protein [Methanosarcina sp. MSH10X1]
MATEIIIQPGNSIQNAVNDSSPGDVITVKPGTYTGNINVTKNNIIIRSESGNPDNTVLKAGKSTANVLILRGDNIKVTGFKTIGATGSGYSGIALSSCSNCTIENNKLLNNSRGISLSSSTKNKISKNTATNNKEYGIVLGVSTKNTISGNTANNNARAIYFGSSDDNILSGNIAQYSSVLGFYICPKSDRNRIYDNYFNENNISIKNGIGNAYNNTRKIAGTNIAGGPYIGGNFWAKPDGTGFSQTTVDGDGDGISDSAYNNITGSVYSDYMPLAALKQKPVVSFSSNVTSGNAPLGVLFTDTSTGTPTSWSWSFGDGTNSTQRNPVHTYSTAGNYTVTLTATNAQGTGTVTKAEYIKVGATSLPVANFWGSPVSGNAPLNVTFKDNSTGSPAAWNWSFGDGTYSTVQSPKHTYSAAGNYTVKLTVSNIAGSNTKTKASYIKVQGTASQTPVAAFTASPTSGNIPLSVSFTDTSTGTPTSWSWSFGDGTYSTDRNPAHTYSTQGNYTVALTVSNAAGSNTVTKTGHISVGTTLSKPVVSFWGSQTSGTAPLTITFTDASTNTPTAWNWNFGDGTYSTLQKPKHTYLTAGNYTVTLNASNAAGTGTKTRANYIKVTGTSPQIPTAAFSASPTSGNTPLSVTFTDSSTGSPIVWSWNFGDGTTSATQNPVHTYSTAGNYTVTLTVTNTAGNNTVTKSNYIKATANSTTNATIPVVSFWGSRTSGTAPLTITFTDASTNTPTAWNWSFGDGTYSTLQKPKHTYLKAGTYSVTLKASNAAGTGTKTRANYIKMV